MSGTLIHQSAPSRRVRALWNPQAHMPTTCGELAREDLRFHETMVEAAQSPRR
jgi:hypothetical protein